MNEMQIRMRVREMSLNELRDFVLQSVEVLQECVEQQRHTRRELHFLEKWGFYE